MNLEHSPLSGALQSGLTRDRSTKALDSVAIDQSREATCDGYVGSHHGRNTNELETNTIWNPTLSRSINWPIIVINYDDSYLELNRLFSPIMYSKMPMLKKTKSTHIEIGFSYIITMRQICV